MHPLHGIGRDGAMDDRYTEVLQSRGAHGGRLVERPGLHRVTIVEHDLTSGCLEGFELLLGRLTACDPARHGLGGVGETGEGREQRRHYGSHPPVKPARLSPRMMCGFVRITRDTKSVRKFSTIARIGP